VISNASSDRLLRGCEGGQGHGLLVQLERAVSPEPPAGPGGRGHRHPDAGVQLAAEGGREAAARAGERGPAPEDRSGLQLAGQPAAVLLQHQHRGAARPGGALLQGAGAVLQPGRTQVRRNHEYNLTKRTFRVLAMKVHCWEYLLVTYGPRCNRLGVFTGRSPPQRTQELANTNIIAPADRASALHSIAPQSLLLLLYGDRGTHTQISPSWADKQSANS